ILEVERALGEMRRVLKSTGKLVFAEHGLAPEERVQRWQHRLNPIWKKIGGGCNLNRPMASLIEGAGFAIEDLDAGYMPGPRFAAYMYRGVARPR
ncbi:MAG: SAM-dependent methyltransferase, partial [Gammaproteobacteria bacterium]